MTADVPPAGCKNAREFLDQFEPVINDLHALLTSNAIFIRRTADVGVLSPAMAVGLRLHRAGAARQRRRLGPAPRWRTVLH